MVIWIIGMSGAGKSTLAKHVVGQLRESGRKVALIDGDVIRELFGNDVDHTIEGRRRNASRISHLTKFLSDQDIDVVAAVLSIFPDWQKWNRENIKDYSEVYLKTSLQTLIRRDTKGLYAKALAGEIKNVVGIDIVFPEPLNPDLVINNDLDINEFDAMVGKVLDLVNSTR